MTELLLVITITILAVLSPGADFALVTRNSLLLSRRHGVFTAPVSYTHLTLPTNREV